MRRFPEPEWESDFNRMRGRGGAFLQKSRAAERKNDLTLIPYFCNYRHIAAAVKKTDPLLVTRSADRFAALGAEPRPEILRLLLSAHPAGMIAGEVQEELEIPASTLSPWRS